MNPEYAVGRYLEWLKEKEQDVFDKLLPKEVLLYLQIRALANVKRFDHPDFRSVYKRFYVMRHFPRNESIYFSVFDEYSATELSQALVNFS